MVKKVYIKRNRLEPVCDGEEEVNPATTNSMLQN